MRRPNHTKEWIMKTRKMLFFAMLALSGGLGMGSTFAAPPLTCDQKCLIRYDECMWLAGWGQTGTWHCEYDLLLCRNLCAPGESIASRQ